MNLIHLTEADYRPSYFAEKSPVRRRALFFVTSSELAGVAQACMGLVENRNSPGRVSSMSSIPLPTVPLTYELAGDSPVFEARDLERCFTRLFAQAIDVKADEVAVPVHGWFGPLFAVDSNVLQWGVKPEALEELLRAACGKYSGQLLLVSKP